MRCLFYTFHGSSAFYPLISVLPSYPRFTLSSVFYPHIRVLPSRPFVRSFVRPSVSVLHFHPYPRFTLTLIQHDRFMKNCAVVGYKRHKQYYRLIHHDGFIKNCAVIGYNIIKYGGRSRYANDFTKI